MSLLAQWPDLLTVEEAAEIIRATPAVIDDFIQAGEIAFTEIAGKKLIPRQFLEKFNEKIARYAIIKV